MERSFGASVADTAVVGQGNPYCTDDGVGVAVARRLPSDVGENCAVWEAAQSGVYLAEKLLGFSRVLIIDGTPSLPPGEICVRPLREWEAVGGDRRGAHGMSLSQALEMLERLTSQSSSDTTAQSNCDATPPAHPKERSVGACLRRSGGACLRRSGEARSRRAGLENDQVRIPEVWALAVGIPPDPPFGEGLSPRVAAAVEAAVEEVRGWLNS